MKQEETLLTTVNEVIFAFVKPTGTDLSCARNALKESCEKINAELIEIELTDIFDQITKSSWNKQSSEIKNKKDIDSKIKNESKASESFKKISKRMHIGSELRRLYSKDIFAKYGIARINLARSASLERDEKNGKKYNHRIYLIDSMKHPKEVELFRQVYGDAFFLISVDAPVEKRIKNLMLQRKSNNQLISEMEKKEAVTLIERDAKEGYDYGQKMREVYQMGDLFLSESVSFGDIERFIHLIFGNSKLSPHRHEYFMHLAFASAAFSSDLSRQVGAVLVSQENEIIATGPNEVPKAGGGQYSSGEYPDARDVIIGHEPNHKRKLEIDFPDLTEYQRSVHAEMECILSCARRGQSIRGATLYCTTYPCHNCARHLIGAGIKQVIYVEAYPKSRALELHPDAIVEDIESDSYLTIKKFQGIGPRRFHDLFSQTLTSGKIIERKLEDEGMKRSYLAKIFLAMSCTPKFPLFLETVLIAEWYALNWVINKNILVKNTKQEFENAKKAN